MGRSGWTYNPQVDSGAFGRYIFAIFLRWIIPSKVLEKSGLDCSENNLLKEL